MTTPHPSDSDKSPETLIHTLRLAMISGVGPRLLQALLERFDTPEAILSAAPSQLREVEGIGPKLSQKIAAARDEIDAEAEIDLCRKNDIHILTEQDKAYPRMLREIHDPPVVLFVKGQIQAHDALAIAMVGSRHASHYGITQAERLAASLSHAGYTIVSGLARGIDAAAHRGALSAGGRTLAVLGSGLLEIYPPEHKLLADQVSNSGALISELPTRFKPLSGSFPQRNRILTGLALGVIVVEAAERSGALISARHSMEQGREVFAVPGRVDNRNSRGCHRLIRDGAKLVETADDVLEELGPLVEATPREDGRVVHHPAELQLNDLEQRVLGAIGSEPVIIDQVVQQSDLPVHRVLSTLNVLEMRRLVRRLSGSQVVRV